MTAARPRDVWWVRLSWLWLVLLAPLLVFSNGRWQLAAAALAAPFFARLYLFSQPVIRGLTIFLLLQLVAYLIMWWEVIPAPGVLYYIIAAAYGLCYFLPFVLDRSVAVRIDGFAATLVLPVSWYLVEILIQHVTPYGSWSSAGYTQMGHGLLTPLAAWVGVAGVAFITLWAASVASWCILGVSPVSHRAVVLALWASAMAASIWAASIPLPGAIPAARPLQVAAITPDDSGTKALAREIETAMQSADTDAEFLVRIDNLSSRLNEQLLARTREAAQSGAQLVLWSETAGHVLAAQEERFIARGQALAREHQLYLFIGLGVWHPDSQPPLENKVIAIMPSGEIAWQYQKARPIVGSEAPILPPGHNELATLDTKFGRIGLVICHDLDFADFVAQAGRKEVDLMLTPSADWSVIADLHAKMGVMRAVENGFWLLRPAYDGLSLIASPKGRVVHAEYDAALEERVLSGRIPLVRADTLYPHVRMYLPFVAVLLLAGLLLLAWRRGPSQ